MFYLLIVLFAGTLVYLTQAERFRTYAKLVAAQGFLLFAIALIELKTVNLANLIFVAANPSLQSHCGAVFSFPDHQSDQGVQGSSEGIPVILCPFVHNGRFDCKHHPVKHPEKS